GACIPAELLPFAEGQVDQAVPFDAMLGNIRVALVIEESVPRIVTGGHGSGQILIELGDSAGRSSVGAGGRECVQQVIRELEGIATREPLLDLQLDAI